MTATPTSSDFGPLLKSLRNARNMTQRSLAKALADQGEDVTDRSVSGWEVGKFKPDRRYVLVLEDVLDAQGVLLDSLGLGGRADGVDRLADLTDRVVILAELMPDMADQLADIERRVAALEGSGVSLTHLASTATGRRVSEQPAEDDLPDRLAAARGNPERKKRIRKTRPSPPPEDG